MVIDLYFLFVKVLTLDKTLVLDKNPDPEISKTGNFHRGYLESNSVRTRVIGKIMRLSDVDLKKVQNQVDLLKSMKFLVQLDCVKTVQEFIIIFDHFDENVSKIRGKLNESETLHMTRYFIQGFTVMHGKNMVVNNLTERSLVTTIVDGKRVYMIFVDVTEEKRDDLLDYCSPEEINFYVKHKTMLPASKSKNIFSFAITIILSLTGYHLFDTGIDSIRDNICNPYFKPQFKKLRASIKLKRHHVEFLFLLIQSMIKHQPENRIPMCLACNSIFMWSNRTIKEFLETSSLFINGCNDTKVTFNLNSDIKKIFHNYQLKLHTEVNQKINQQNVYANEPSECIRCFRNMVSFMIWLN
jgi:hypothetical protein